MSKIFRDHHIKKGRERLAEVRAWRDAAIADAWDCKATYTIEPIESAAQLTKDGWQAQLLMRDYSVEKPKYGVVRIEAEVSVWGPDGMSVKVSFPYSMERLIAGLQTCHACQKTGITPHRYSFAGRCCVSCLPEMRKQHEKPGWCD